MLIVIQSKGVPAVVPFHKKEKDRIHGDMSSCGWTEDMIWCSVRTYFGGGRWHASDSGDIRVKDV